ncbi:replication protein [Salmonella enterica]|nr:replication protein [Salmonella enterica]
MDFCPMKNKAPPTPQKTLQILSNSAQPITAKRRRPRPKGGNNIAFNNGCCN